MFGGYFLNIHDTSGSETDVNFQRMCQKFILQKERQVFIKCILRNVHNSYVFVHIGRRYCGRETVTPSNTHYDISYSQEQTQTMFIFVKINPDESADNVFDLDNLNNLQFIIVYLGTIDA